MADLDEDEAQYIDSLIHQIEQWLQGSAPVLQLQPAPSAYLKLQQQLLARGATHHPKLCSGFIMLSPQEIHQYLSAPNGTASAAAGGGGSGGGRGGGDGAGGAEVSGAVDGTGTASSSSTMYAAAAAAVAAAAAASGSNSSSISGPLLLRASPEEVAGHSAAAKQHQIDAINAAAGFSLVLEAMRGCGKPMVGHNLRFDLAYCLQQFVTPLPSSWKDFKVLVGKWFPAGVYDTKYLAHQLLGVTGRQIITDTSLGGLHDWLSQVRSLRGFRGHWGVGG
jgi:hypothetical protein